MYVYKKHDDDTSLDRHMRYGFKGWINEIDYNNLNKNKKPTIVNLYDTKIENYDNMRLYAYFGNPEDCRTVASNEDFFEIIKGTVVCGSGSINKIELIN
jgi:hypothetical protein